MNGIPTDEFTERIILGSVICYGDSMDSLRSTLEPDDFSTQRHRDIWGACCAAYDAGAGTEAAHIYQRLAEIGKHESSGGMGYLADLMDGVPQVGIDRDVAKLKETTLMRRLAYLGDALCRRALSGMETAPELQQWLLGATQDLCAQAADNRPISTRDLVDKYGVQELLQPSKRKTGLRLPWTRLQSAIGGMRGGQMIVAAAYTSRGKTSLACQIATHVTRQDTGVFYWTTEMAPDALFRRMIDQMSGVDGMRHRESALTQAEMGRANGAVGWLYDNPIWFDYRSRTMPAALAALRWVRSRNKIGLVVVDHLQHVKSAGRSEPRSREVSDVSRSIKMAAIDCDVPFLVVSQVSRPKEENSSLSIHMLKESGDVENDADVIMLLNSPKPAGLSPISVALNVAKQREGPAGFDIPLLFRPATQSFESLED